MITGGDELLATHRNFRFCFSILHRRISRPVDYMVRIRSAAPIDWTRTFEILTDKLCFWFHRFENDAPFQHEEIFFELRDWNAWCLFHSWQKNKFTTFKVARKTGLIIHKFIFKILTVHDKRRRRTVRAPPRYSKISAQIFRPLDWMVRIAAFS